MDLELMALGSYFAQLLEAVSDEDLPNPAVLSLGLNALSLLSRGRGNSRTVKAAFEMRLMTLAGFAPFLDVCRVCGRPDPQDPRLELVGGTVRCRDCRDGNVSGETASLCADSLAALRHITSCPDKKVFSFTLGEEASSRLEQAAERYTLVQMDRGFSTLDYYRNCRL
jgi:DNA repair protein RecO (recombination protein O)